MADLLQFCPTSISLEARILEIARRKGIFTSDDLHELDDYCGILGRDRRVYGACLRSMRRAGLIRPSVYVSSRRKGVNHGRPVLQWVVNDV